jgi:hypothetical protein
MSRGVRMHIECLCPLWYLAEAWLGVVFLARDGLGQCRNGGAVERGPRAGQRFLRVCPSSEGRLGRVGVLSVRRLEPRANRGSQFLDLEGCA